MYVAGGIYACVHIYYSYECSEQYWQIFRNHYIICIIVFHKITKTGSFILQNWSYQYLIKGPPIKAKEPFNFRR